MRSTGPWTCAMGLTEVGLQTHRSLLKSWFTSRKCAPPLSMGTGGAHRSTAADASRAQELLRHSLSTHTPSAVTMDPCHTSCSQGCHLYDNRENLLPGRSSRLGIVTVLDFQNCPQLDFTLLSTGFKNSTVGTTRGGGRRRLGPPRRRRSGRRSSSGQTGDS